MVQNLTAEREKRICVGKPKDLQKALKSVDLPNKSRGCMISALAQNQIVSQDTTFCL